MKYSKKILLVLCFFFVCFCLGFVLNCFVHNNFVFSLNWELLFKGETYLYAFEIFGIGVCFVFYFWYKNYWQHKTKNLVEADKKSMVDSGLEQAHFQTELELSKNFRQYEFDKLKHIEYTGIPIKAEQVKNKLKITFSKPAHTLIIGTTGSGKTTTFVNPTISILSSTKNKSSMLISDPKGELYSLHAQELRNKGYEIKVIDLRNPYNSICWNPLEKCFLLYQQMLKCGETASYDVTNNAYLFNGNLYSSEEEKEKAILIKKQELFDQVYEELNDICSVLCPITNKSEPIWESGAKNFILAICLAMLEDSENSELNLTIDKFNFYNIMKIATTTNDDCQQLIEYFKYRSPISKSVTLSKQVLDSADKTRGSYLSTIFDRLSLFSDMSICALTSKNEINFEELSDKPTALFLKIPDEKETRHGLASMAILQAYKALVSKANTFEDLSLKRDVFFILDEFGNLPRIHKLEQMITVGRSRKIWLLLVIQSYSQLSKNYDECSADIIKSNCNIQIFIGTNDLKTIEEFSKLCGNYSLFQRNISYGTNNNDNLNSSLSVRERPLIYPSELQQLNNLNNMGNAIITIFGFAPLKSKFTPSFACSKYSFSKSEPLKMTGNYFNEKKCFYDIVERNSKLNNSTKQKLSTEKEKQDFLKMCIERLPIEIFKGEEQIDILKLLDNEEYEQVRYCLKSILERIHDDEDLKNNIIEIIKNLKMMEQK